MISLEQVKLLESKVSRMIDHVKKETEENARLREKLGSYEKRIDELEVLIRRFREDQSRIEDGILSALDRLNQFEDALETAVSMEGTLSMKSAPESKPAAAKEKPAQKEKPAAKSSPPEIEAGEDIDPMEEIPDSLQSSEELDIF